MIKGLAITLPTIGRISIGDIVKTADGKSLPVKDNHFTISMQAKHKGVWVEHAINAKLKPNSANQPASDGDEGKKEEGNSAHENLRSIPVRIMFNDPDLSFSSNYSAFDSTSGRPLCVGDGEFARRFDPKTGKAEACACAGSQYCEFGARNRCKLFGRLNVQIEGQDDPFGFFILRTTGYNSVRTLYAKLQMMAGTFSGLVGLPLNLVLRAKSSRLSRDTPFYYVDLVLRDGVSLEDAAAAMEKARERKGVDQDKLEAAVRAGLARGWSTEVEDDALELECFGVMDMNEVSHGEFVTEADEPDVSALGAGSTISTEMPGPVGGDVANEQPHLQQAHSPRCTSGTAIPDGELTGLAALEAALLSGTVTKGFPAKRIVSSLVAGNEVNV